MTQVQCKVGRSVGFFFWSVSLLISQTKTSIKNKHAVEAAKSNRLHVSLRHVEIRFRKICSCIKMLPHAKLSFLHTLFLENEAQINQNEYEKMLFMSKQVSLSKISSILQKMKIGQKQTYALFARRPSIIKIHY